MKKNIFIKLLSLALLVASTFSACKKDRIIESATQAMLIGSWTETPQTNSIRTIFFGNDGTFTMHLVYLGNPGFGTTYNGSYNVDGNKLIARVNEVVSQEPMRPPVTTKVDYSFFDKATITIKGNVLEMNYFTYPADGPVPTYSKFLKN